MKYIVMRVTDHSPIANVPDVVREIPLIFPESLVHAEMEVALSRVLRRERPDGRHRDLQCVSAGFISSVDLGEICPHGESTSIGIGSRPVEDYRLMVGMDYSHGVVR